MFINSKQCFGITIHVIKNSNIVLSAISCRSDNGTESTAEVNGIKYSPERVRREEREREKESGVSVFPYLFPPATTPETDALYVLTVCRRSFCLFHCVFFASVVFFTPLLFTSVLFLWRLPRRSQTTALSPQSALFDDLHYILFAWRYSGLTCCVCINCGVNDSNKREEQPYGDGNESARHCRGHIASRELGVV